LLHLVEREDFNASVLLANNQFFIAVACHIRKAHAIDAAATFQHPFYHWLTFFKIIKSINSSKFFVVHSRGERNESDGAVVGAIEYIVRARRRQLQACRPSHDLGDHRLLLVLQ
jgi:hypothetical protein